MSSIIRLIDSEWVRLVVPVMPLASGEAATGCGGVASPAPLLGPAAGASTRSELCSAAASMSALMGCAPRVPGGAPAAPWGATATPPACCCCSGVAAAGAAGPTAAGGARKEPEGVTHLGVAASPSVVTSCITSSL